MPLQFNELFSYNSISNVCVIKFEKKHSYVHAFSGGCLTFWYHMYGTGIHSLNVYITRKDQRSLLWSKTGNQGNFWRTESLNITSSIYPSELIFQGVRGSSFRGDVAIDDISYNSSTCSSASGKIYIYCVIYPYWNQEYNQSYPMRSNPVYVTHINRGLGHIKMAKGKYCNVVK